VRSAFAGGLAWLVAWTTSAHAQSPLPGYGNAAAGMGGASIAVPYDSMGAANNPATMAFVGSRTDFSITPIFQGGHIEVGDVHFQPHDIAYAPTGGFNHDLRNGWTAGVSIFGFGSGIDYRQPFPGSTTNTHSSITQIVVAPTATYRFTPQHAIGFAPLLAGQRFKLGGLQFIDFDDQGPDYSSGAGVAVGYLGRFDHGLSVGAAYFSRVWMGRLHKYSGLLADAGKLDIPQLAGLGLAWQIDHRWLLAADAQWIGWAAVKPLGNPFPGNGHLGSSAGPGFAWRNQTIGRFGVAYEVSDEWTVRAGLATRSLLIDPTAAAINTLSPIVPQITVSAGATWRVDAANSLSFAYALNPLRTVSGTQESENVALTAKAQFVTLGFGHAF
jgi:long-chain fatty acid transport protein